MADGRIEFEISADGSRFDRELARIERGVRSASRAAGSAASGAASSVSKVEAALRSAERSVSDALDRSADATARVEVAQRRLTEARERHGDESSQAAAAELELVRAQRQADAAGAGLAQAQTRLADAQEDAAAAAADLEPRLESQTADMQALSRGAERASGRLKGLGSALQGAGGLMSSLGGTLTTAVTAPAIAAAAAAGTFALRTASAAETTQISFTTMLGSEEAALSMMDELADFAATTPFELSGLQDATRQLLAYGFTADEIIPMLTDVGDATAALGTGQVGIEAVTRALGQMQTKGKVSAEEMLQLTEQGVPAWEYLARAIGTDTAGAMEAVSDGAVNASDGIAAITSGMRDDFGGMMEAQSKTVEGLMSNLSDAIEQPLMKLRESDAYDAFAAALSRVVDAAGPFVESLLPHLERGLDAVSGVLDTAAGAMERFASMSRREQDSILKMAAGAVAAGPALKVLGKGTEVAGKAADKASDLVKWFGEKVTDLATSPKTASTTLGKLAGVVAKFPGPAALAAGGIVLLGTGIADFVRWSTEGERQARVQAEALEVLGSASDVADGSMEAASEGAGSLGRSIYELGQDVQENWQDLAHLGEAFAEIDAKANAQIGSLSRARGAIADYAGQAGLTSQEQGALRAAVEAVNSACGTNYEVVRDSDGAYQVMQDGVNATKEELYELIDAQIAQAKVSAQTEKLESLYKAQADQASDYAEAVDRVKDAEEAYADAYERGLELADENGWENVAESREAYAKAFAKTTADGLQKARDEAAELQEQMGETGSAIESTEQTIANIQGAAEGAAEGFDALVLGSTGLNELFGGSQDTMADFADALEASGVSLEEYSQMSDAELLAIAAAWDGSSEGIRSAIQATGAELGTFTGILSAVSPEVQSTAATLASAMGLSLGQLESQLAGMGVTAEQMSGISQQQFAAMAVVCGGDISTLAWMIQNYNQTPILDKNGNVTANTASLRDAQGQVYTWNGTQLVDKSGSAVVYMSDLTDAQREKIEWNESGIATLDGKAVVDDSELIDAQGNKVKWNGSDLEPKETWADVETSGLESGISLLSTWNNMPARSKSATFTTTTTNRTVNVVENQTVQRSAPAPAMAPAASSRAAAAPATASAQAEPAAQAAPAAASAALMSVRLPSAAEAITAAVAASVPSVRAAEAERRSREREEGSERRQERMVRRVERACERVERALTSPVELRAANKRELGRLVKEVS